jgi:hypothetical protein
LKIAYLHLFNTEAIINMLRHLWISSGYGSDFELLQFMHDLSLYLSLTGASSSASCSSWLALGGKMFSYQYWRWQHCILQDLQRQLGCPQIFLTIAPYEWSFPWASWIDQLRADMGRQVTGLSGPESLHIAHILKEVVRGAIAGVSGSKPWTTHLLKDKLGSEKLVEALVWRIEYQDGMKKASVLHLFNVI